MNGAQQIVETLERHGVDVVFGYPGGAIMPVYDALYDRRIEHVLCRHEQGAVLASVGYARASKRVGVCLATSGPGSTNLITGLADALLDSIPVVAITGQVDVRIIGTDAFQEVDAMGLSLACTKHSFLVRSAETLVQTLSHAFRIASRDRPGPVWIDVPKNIQIRNQHTVDERTIVASVPVPKSSNADAAHRLLQESRRPMLCVGGGVYADDAVSRLRKWISISGVPSVTTLKGLGASSSAEHLGMVGMHGSKAANLAVQECDLLIAVGSRFDDRVTGRIECFAPNAKIIHLDVDASEFDKIKTVDVALLGNLRHYLSIFGYPLRIARWKERVELLQKKHRCNRVFRRGNIRAPLFLRTMSDHLPSDCIVTTDVGQHQMWTAQHVRVHRPESFITSSGLGTMGFGIPAAVGAQIAHPRRTVVCVSGDGSFMMNVQELATIKRKKLPIKIVLLDNQKLGMVRQWQKLFYRQRYSETKLNDNPDFLALTRAFSISGTKIHRASQVTNAIRLLLRSPKTFLLHVSVDASMGVWPLVPPGFSNQTMLEKF